MKTSQRVTLVFLIVSCQLVIACGRPPSRRPCVRNIYVALDSFDSAESGARAAVRRLSEEIHRCNEATEYYIHWRYPGGPQDRGWLALKYTRRDKTSGLIGYEYDLSSGTREPTYFVDDGAVDEVAKEGGLLSDFEKYQKNKK